MGMTELVDYDAYYQAKIAKLTGVEEMDKKELREVYDQISAHSHPVF